MRNVLEFLKMRINSMFFVLYTVIIVQATYVLTGECVCALKSDIPFFDQYVKLPVEQAKPSSSFSGMVGFFRQEPETVRSDMRILEARYGTSEEDKRYTTFYEAVYETNECIDKLEQDYRVQDFYKKFVTMKYVCADMHMKYSLSKEEYDFVVHQYNYGTAKREYRRQKEWRIIYNQNNLFGRILRYFFNKPDDDYFQTLCLGHRYLKWRWQFKKQIELSSQ